MNRVLATLAEQLAKESSFVEAIQREVGQELIKFWLIEADRLLAKIIDEKATDEERAEFRVIKKQVNNIVSRVNEYHRKLNDYKSKMETQR